MEDEIIFEDLFYLELLKFKFYNIYMILYNHPSLFLENSESVYHLKDNILNHEVFKEYTEHDKQRCHEILKYLFSKIKKHEMSLCKVRNYPHYFMLHLDDKILTIPEFISLMRKNIKKDELYKEAKSLYSKKYKFEFKHAASCILKDIPSMITDYKPIYQALSLLCSCDNILLRNEINEAITYHAQNCKCQNSSHLKDLLDLVNVIDVENSESSSNYMLGFLLISILIKEELESRISQIDNNEAAIIQNFLETSNHPTSMSKAISSFIRGKSDKLQDQLILNFEELRKVQLEIFKNYTNKLSEDGTSLLDNCLEYPTDDIVRPSLQKEAIEIMKQEILNKPIDYLKTFVKMGYTSNDEFNHVFPDIRYLEYFGDNNNFEKFLMEYRNNPDTERAINFWEIYKYNGYESIPFENQGSVTEKFENKFRNERRKLDELLEIKNKIEKGQIDEELKKKLNKNDLYIKLHGDLSKIIDK